MATEAVSDVRNGAENSDDHDGVVEEAEFKEVDISEDYSDNSHNNASPGNISETVSPSNTTTSVSASTNGPTILSRPLNPISPAQQIPAPMLASKKFTVSSFKDWSKTALKCTKQVLSERLGIGTKTVDSELEQQIESLLDTRRKYQLILNQMQALTKNFSCVLQSQKDLSDSFSDLSQKIPELNQEFSCNAETQKVTYKSGLVLEGTLNYFISNVDTLCSKTMEDTFITVKQYEFARVEYDAFRTDFEQLKQSNQSDAMKLKEAEVKYQTHLEKFDQMRSDLNIKMKLLDENKTKVMRRNLVHLHDAVTAYYSGNHQAVQENVKQFKLSLSESPGSPSWLETSD